MADELQLALRIRADVDDAARAFDGLERAMRGVGCGAGYPTAPASRAASARANTPSATTAIMVHRKRRSRSRRNSKPSFGARSLRSARTADGSRDLAIRIHGQRGDATHQLNRPAPELRVAAGVQEPSAKMRNTRMPTPTAAPAHMAATTKMPYQAPSIQPPMISSVVELSENGGGSGSERRSSRQPSGQPSSYPARHSRGQSRGGRPDFNEGAAPTTGEASPTNAGAVDPSMIGCLGQPCRQCSGPAQKRRLNPLWQGSGLTMDGV